MQKNYDGHISKNIKALYLKRLAGPLLYLIFSVVLWSLLPVASVLFPKDRKSVV